MNQPLTPDVHRVTRVRLAAGLAVLALALIAACAGTGDQHDELRLTVMSFNVWGAGGNDGRSIDDTVAVIR
ncbi:MAG: hypothetical protein WBM57_10055, partial [Woeseiaceae bacterium]